MRVSPAFRQKLRKVLSWSGLVLMLICFLWLEFVPSSGENTSRTAVSPVGKSIGLVIIDAGHGGQDSGAMRHGVLEKNLTLDVALRIEGLARVHGFRTLLTRPNDTWVSLADRATVANRENNCIFVSIHFDEGSRPTATGVQTFYAFHSAPKFSLQLRLPFLQPVLPQAVNVESQSLAGFVQEGLIARTHAVDRGTRAEQFFVVANVRHPAVLVEGGFLSNDEEIVRLTSEDYRQQLAAGITDGIVRYRDLAAAREPAMTLGTTTR